MFVSFQPFNKKIRGFLVARRIKTCDILGDFFKEHPFSFVMDRKMCKVTRVLSSFSPDVQGRGND